jgi:hypothetical protein
MKKNKVMMGSLFFTAMAVCTGGLIGSGIFQNPIGSAEEIDTAEALDAGSFVIPFGDGEGVYREPGFEPETERFGILSDGTVIVLDSVDRELLMYQDDEWIGSMALEQASYVLDMEIVDDYLYLLDVSYEVSVYHVGEGMLCHTSVISGRDYTEEERYFGIPYSLSAEPDRVLINYLGEESRPVLYNPDTKMIDTVSPIAAKDTGRLNSLASGLTESLSGGVSVVTDYIDGNTSYVLCREYTDEEERFYALKLDSDGNVIGIADPDISGCRWYGPEFYHVQNDQLYLMTMTENGVLIQYRAFTDNAIIHLIPQNTVDVVGEELQTGQNERGVTSFNPPTQTRVQALTRGMNFISKTWTLNSVNRTISDPSLNSIITIPSYITSIPSASLPSSMTGVPYCWGGYMDQNSFASNINSGWWAGNVNTSNIYGHVWHTAGVDCSGFVSKCYDQPYNNTPDYYVGSTSVAWSNLAQSDYLVRYSGSSGHIVLYYQNDPSPIVNDILFLDSSTVAEMVAVRSATKSYFDGAGYIYKRGFVL